MKKFHLYIGLGLALAAPLSLQAAPLTDLWVIPNNAYTGYENTLSSTLIGLVNSSGGATMIWQSGGTVQNAILGELQGQGIVIHNVSNVWQLVTQFKSYIHGGIQFQGGTPSINVACSLCGLQSCVAVETSLVATAAANGIAITQNVVGQNDAWTFANYASQFTKGMMVDQPPGNSAGCRDYGVGHKSFFFSEAGFSPPAPDTTYGQYFGPQCDVFGYIWDEHVDIAALSTVGASNIVTDNAINFEALSHLSPIQPLQKPARPTVAIESNVSYVAFVMTDGDNLAWEMGDFGSNTAPWFGSPLRGNFPMTWEISPYLAHLAPLVLEYYYKNASPNDGFVGGAWGPGYEYPYDQPAGGFAAECNKGQAALVASQIAVPGIINDTPGSLNDPAPLMAFPNVQGAVYKRYPDYSGLNGAIAWSNCKPIVSEKYLLGNNGSANNLPAYVASQLNGLPKAPLSDQNSYSLVCVAAWDDWSSQGGVRSPLWAVQQTINQLGPNVRVVTADQIVDMLKRTFGGCSNPVTQSTWRVNAAGPNYTDSTGKLWVADTNFNGGTAAGIVTNTITNSADSTLYDSQRYGSPFTYTFNVPAGSYQVSLLFAETYWTAAGQRIFNVSVNGNQVLTNFDIFAAAGGMNRAVTEVFNNITASGGTISIQLGPTSVDLPEIQAIQIIPQATTPTATPTFSICPSWVGNGNTVLGAAATLTGAVNSETGSVWNKNCISLAQNFNMTFKVYFGAGPGADGIDFVLQNDPRGTAAIGDGGGNKGYSGNGLITPSMAFVTETYGSNGSLQPEENGSTANSCGNVIGTCPFVFSSNLCNGAEHSYNVVWNAATHVLTLSLDGQIVMTYSRDLVNSVFGGSSCVYYGFTAATGGSNNLQYVYLANCYTPTFTATPTKTNTPTTSPTLTNTRTSSPTFTTSFTSTSTFTPTATPTFTRTFTSTSTNTSTASYTNSFTATPTATRTFTSTASFTSSFTASPTATRTNSPTFTKTSTPTFTFSPFNTFTQTSTSTNSPVPPTATFTSTPTRSFTPTSTYTFTSTNTSTSTYSFTPTATPTRTNTPVPPTTTFTRTSTSTPTVTQTFTFSPFNTFTQTPTSTNTPVPPTASATASSTPTASSTSSWTFTPTSSFTKTSAPTDSTTPTPSPMGTSTATLTATASPSPTDTFTGSPTPSFTRTSTFTSTASLTLTFTFSPFLTFTQTPTSTSTFTNTRTSTPVPPSNTFTSTSTNNVTNTVTVTATKTSTPSMTSSATATSTATSSFTPVPPTATSTATFTSTYTTSFTRTSTPTFTLSPSFTFTPTSSSTFTPTATFTRTSTATSTSSFTPSATPTRTPSATATTTPSSGPIIYPNPISGPGPAYLSVPLTGVSNVQVQVYTSAFRMVNSLSFANVTPGTPLPIPLTDRYGNPLANGLYYVVVQAQGKRWIVKMMVLH